MFRGVRVLFLVCCALLLVWRASCAVRCALCVFGLVAVCVLLVDRCLIFIVWWLLVVDCLSDALVCCLLCVVC